MTCRCAAEPTGDVLDTAHAGPLALRGSILRVLGYGGGMLLALVAVPLLIRHLGQDGFGRYVTAVSIVTIAAGLTEGGVNTIALREFSTRAGAERAQAMGNMIGIRIVLSALGILGAVAFTLAAGYDATLVFGTAVAGVGVMIQIGQSLLTVPLQATMRFGWVAAADMLRQVVSTSLIVALVLLGAHLVGLLAILIPATLSSFAFTAWRVRGMTSLRPRLDLHVALPLLRETFPFAIAIALNSIYFRLTVVIMSLSASALQTGYFSTSFRVVEVLIGLPALVIGAGYPIITRARRDDPERFDYGTRRMFELSVLLGVWVALTLELGAGFIANVLGGHAAAPAAAVLRIQGLAVMGTFVAVACSFPMLSLRRHRELLLANAFGLIVTLALAISLVPGLHARGAAVATVGAELALATVTALGLVRARPELRLPLSVVPIALACGGLADQIARLTGVHPVLEVLIGTAIYLAGITALGRFPPEVGHVFQTGRTADGVR